MKSKKIGAFIISNLGFDTYKLLTFKVIAEQPSSYYHNMLHIPTGGFGQADTPEHAIFACIQNRIGITSDDVTITRKLGSYRYFRSSIDEHVERHDFLLTLQVPYPLTWRYQSKLYNMTEDLEIQMVTTEHLQLINSVFRNNINKEQIPELFPA